MSEEKLREMVDGLCMQLQLSEPHPENESRKYAEAAIGSALKQAMAMQCEEIIGQIKILQMNEINRNELTSILIDKAKELRGKDVK